MDTTDSALWGAGLKRTATMTRQIGRSETCL
jgi:hypothetical protein